MGGEKTMVGIDFDKRVANFKARLRGADMGKMAHRHGDWTQVHCRCNKGGEEDKKEEEEPWQRQCNDQP